MRFIKRKAIIAAVSLVLTTALFADNKILVKEKTKATALVKQAGGYSNITNTQLQELIDKDVLLIDIRRKDEWQQTGIIEGSKAITFFDETGRISADFLPQFTAIAEKDQPVILICRTGARTKAASQAIAQQLGYENVLNATTGIMSWIGEKRPVVKY